MATLADGYQGVYIGTVRDARVVAEGTDQVDAATYVHVVINEVIHSGTPSSTNGRDADFSVGSTVLLAFLPPTGDTVCQGLGRDLRSGDVLIVTPQVWDKRWRSDDGSSAVYAPLLRHAQCVSGDFVALQDRSEADSLDESGQIPLEMFKAVLFDYWGMDERTAAERVRAKCEQLQCSPSSDCFFGEGCLRLDHAPDGSRFLGSFNQDGTERRGSDAVASP